MSLNQFKRQLRWVAINAALFSNAPLAAERPPVLKLVEGAVGVLIHPLRKVVEAPGVAPGSENTSPSESTCVAASVVSRPTSRTGENRRAPAPENLAGTVQDNRCQPAC